VASLLDGGETSDGAPYFVMEFIEGQSLIEATKDWAARRNEALEKLAQHNQRTAQVLELR
jgi:hypothetical protein